jgi:hypothetical protein
MSSTLSKLSNTLIGLYIDNVKNEDSLNECLYSISKQSHKVDLIIFHSGLSDEELVKLKLIADNQVVKFRSKQKDGSVKEEIIGSTEPINYTISQISADNFPVLFNQVFTTSVNQEYEYFSIIEQEDVLSANWFKTVDFFAKDNKGISIFLPLLRNVSHGVFNGFMNEAAWAEGMSEEAGKMDMNLLLRFNCANVLGAAYKVSSLKLYCEDQNLKTDDGTYHLMKDSLKLSHYYEMFLRLVYNDVKVMTIPRIGYEMRIIRKEYFNPISSKIPQDIANLPLDKGGITLEEGRFWVDLAKKEYFFDADRNKKYEKA